MFFPASPCTFNAFCSSQDHLKRSSLPSFPTFLNHFPFILAQRTWQIPDSSSSFPLSSHCSPSPSAPLPSQAQLWFNLTHLLGRFFFACLPLLIKKQEHKVSKILGDQQGAASIPCQECLQRQPWVPHTLQAHFFFNEEKPSQGKKDIPHAERLSESLKKKIFYSFNSYENQQTEKFRSNYVSLLIASANKFPFLCPD